MKMKYEKPMAAVERYELSQAIAGCVTKIGPSGSRGCIIANSNLPSKMQEAAIGGMFADHTCMPGMIPAIGTEYDGICYHTLTAATFQS